MKKFLSIMVVLLLSVVVFTGCHDKSDQNQVKTKQKPLVVAMELTHPPFERKDDKGNPDGISVEFIKAFGEYVGRDVKIESVSYDSLIPALQKKKADMVISSMTITDEGKQLVDFSEPYANVMSAVLVDKDSDITSIESLNQKEKKVVVIANSTGYIFAQKNLPNAEIIILPDKKSCTSELINGNADGFIDNQLTIYDGWQENPETTKLIPIENQTASEWGIAIQKGTQNY
ncbi:transporter substrate-binding domain-containing protein [Aminipila terrae]|uniref:transporter substrate-binding domain-containing protein n=1 Tax=Aminipila terrae TaxID=2697030 RepID=UPI001FAD7915|nr:transporter substrate-binding domain-containing protein [Aminipila terrae]